MIVYDVRGHGKSEKPHGEYSIQTFADDLYAFMRGLKIEKATIGGISMGGMVALTFALDHPEMVSKLVLLGTTAKGDRMMYYQIWVLNHILPYKTYMRMLTNLLITEKTSEQEKEAYYKMFMGTPKHVTLKCGKDMYTKYDVSNKISRIKTPTLIIVGEKDNVLPVAKSQFLNREISGSKLVIIPNAKHVTIFQNSKEVNEAIEEFIK